MFVHSEAWAQANHKLPGRWRLAQALSQGPETWASGFGPESGGRARGPGLGPPAPVAEGPQAPARPPGPPRTSQDPPPKKKTRADVQNPFHPKTLTPRILCNTPYLQKVRLRMFVGASRISQSVPKQIPWRFQGLPWTPGAPLNPLQVILFLIQSTTYVRIPFSWSNFPCQYAMPPVTAQQNLRV